MSPSLLKLSAVVTIASLMSGCISHTASAPVINAWYQPAAKKSAYRVQKGDTLYSIAWAFGLDYRKLATINHLYAPYELRIGQSLRMTTAPKNQSSPSILSPSPINIPQPNKALSTPALNRWYQSKNKLHWTWPAKGKIISGFSPSRTGNNGLDISGRLGETIKAAASGQVVYSGSGIRGYGNLVIIKHNRSLLSAYAYNNKIYVKVGDIVRAGQRIATMGTNTANQVMVHFEIRRYGKPINPMTLLKRRR